MALRGIALALGLVLAGPGPAAACIGAAHETTEMPATVVLDLRSAGRGLWGAWFDDPTTRYGHGVLGDAIEAGSLYAYSDRSANTCAFVSVRLDPSHVFEDVAPRLADLDGDGRNEIVVVRSSLSHGAQLAVYGDALDGESLRLVAATPYIGRANRWLAPIGVADLDGDGAIEIAYIDRPHLARVLRIWRFVPDGAGGGALVELAAMQGLTNHRIGDPTIPGGIRDCGEGPEMITADRHWARVLATTFRNGTFSSRSLGPWQPGALNAALACP